ncbi:MAG TPA: thioesterase family protein [Bacteroidia bacterium]|jgi:acyl-CoA thioester hydrolase|nr:thioesterase family protein [Bacteroidia bacterium]
MEPKDFKHKIKIQIRYKDVDKQGHVNNANHFTYFETGRIEYFKEIYKKPINWSEEGLILARNEINYLMPILLEDEVYCYTKVNSFGTKSFEISCLLTRTTPSGEQICADGKCIVVCFNYATQKTIEIPKDWKEAMDIYESK